MVDGDLDTDEPAHGAFDAGLANADICVVGDDEGASTAKRKAASYVGQVVGGRYQVDSIIALGGMGAVFRAQHVHMRKQVALKILHPTTENLPELVARFERESIVGAHVSHPSVCQATDFGRLEDGSHYLVLEYVQGRTLQEVLREGRIEAARAAEIARQIASGLGAAHQLGIYHRDVKPSNLMLCDGPQVQVKIVDFGLAKLPKGRFHVDEKMTVTTAGMVFGTVAYMAPELARGMHMVDHRSDLYALGVILYEMLAGKRPHEAVDQAELFKLIRTRPPPPIAERAPGVEVPPELEAVVLKLLEKEPAARFQSAEALIDALDEASPPEVGSTPIPSGRASLRSLVPDQGAVDRGRGPAEVDPSDASPRPVTMGGDPPYPPARPATLETSPQSSSITMPKRGRLQRTRLVLGSVMVVLLGLAGVKGFAPDVWAKLGSGGERMEARTPVASPPAHAAPESAPSPSAEPAAVASSPGAPSASGVSRVSPAASASVAPGGTAADAYPMRFALGEAATAHDAKRGALALLALARTAPETFRDRDVIANAAAVAVTVALGEPALADEVFAVLSGPALGESGPDVLFHVTSFYGGSRGAVRAADLLATPAVLERASPALRIARDLKATPCRERAALFDRAAAEGDDRTLNLLSAMLAPDCAATPQACCAPSDARLVAANAALRRRLRR